MLQESRGKDEGRDLRLHQEREDAQGVAKKALKREKKRHLKKENEKIQPRPETDLKKDLNV